MKSLVFSKEMQFDKKELSTKECESLHKQWQQSDIKLIVDSPVGKQIFKWLEAQNKIIDADFKRFNVSAFKEFRSPVDGTMIASRKQLADHERRHGIKQVGNDFNNIRKEQ